MNNKMASFPYRESLSMQWTVMLNILKQNLPRIEN